MGQDVVPYAYGVPYEHTRMGRPIAIKHVIPAGVLKFSPSLNLRSYSTGQTYEIIASGWYFSICYHGTDHSRLS